MELVISRLAIITQWKKPNNVFKCLWQYCTVSGFQSDDDVLCKDVMLAHNSKMYIRLYST